MSHFLKFRDDMEAAISVCLSSTSDYRNQHAVSEVPSKVIETLATQHIAPLAGKTNLLDIPVLEGRPDWRKNATEVVFRKTFLDIAVSDILVSILYYFLNLFN